jgi:hypothetical protein
MRYRKKPVVIEAFQWDGQSHERQCSQWFAAAANNGIISYGTRSQCLFISTLEGVMTAQPEDFIIQGVNGEIYPCEPDIFLATYEPVQEGEG